MLFDRETTLPQMSTHLRTPPNVTPAVLPAGGRTYVQEGGEVELKPEGAPPTITSISWKFGPDLAADWDGVSVDYYRHFEGRLCF